MAETKVVPEDGHGGPHDAPHARPARAQIVAPLLDMLSLSLDRDQQDAPLYQQIYDGLVAAIERRLILPRQRLPSTRALAEDLGLSRTTVVQAYDQLTAEGWIDGQTGAGTYVAAQPPIEAGSCEPRINPALKAAGHVGRPAMTMRAEIADVPLTLRHMRKPVPFRPNFPAIDAFPIPLWARSSAETLRQLSREQASNLLGEGDPQGLFALREQVSIHVARSRGIACSAADVVIFVGAQQAVDLCARLLLLPGDRVICEDPGYDGIHASVVAASAVPVPITLDEGGLDVARARAAIKAEPYRAQMIYTTPSKQFPVGQTMSLLRRIELIDFAKEHNAWILEDDYDCEFRYGGRSLPSLYSLDGAERVIYLGTFSKTLFPALRLGYAILPKRLVEPMVSARTALDRYAPMLPQLQVANFLQSGHFAKHVRRMRRLYADRQRLLLDAIDRHLSDWLVPTPTETGFELIAALRPALIERGLTATAVAQSAQRVGLEITTVSAFARLPCLDDRFVLGFACFTARQVETAAIQLRQVLEDLTD